MLYFATMSIAQASENRMKSNGLQKMWKEVVVVYFKYYLDICLEAVNKTTRNFSQHCRSPGRDLNLLLTENKQIKKQK